MKLFILFYLLFGFMGCASNTPSMQRVDSKALQLTTIHWGSEDLHEMAEAMVVSLLKSNILNSSEKKVFSLYEIKNNTYDHIQTDSIIYTIKVSLIKSNKVDIVDIKKRDMINNELDYQNNNKKYFQEIKKTGKQLGVDGIFTGSISAIYQQNNLSKDMFFKLTLSLVDIETSQIIWSDEVQIRKIRKKAVIGW